MIPFRKLRLTGCLVWTAALWISANSANAETPIGLAAGPARTISAKTAEVASPKKTAAPASTASVAAGSRIQTVAVPEPDKDAENDASTASPVKGDSWWSAAKAIGATVFIIGLILGAMTLLKRYMPYRFGPLGHTRQIQVLESVPIGEKRMLTLVEVGGQRLLLASSPGNVTLLKELPAHSEARASVEPITPVARKPEIPTTFNQTLKTQLAAQDKVRDPQTLLVRLTQIRQALEAR